MPGYGFAKAPKDIARKWRYLVNDYLRGRQVLKRALVLVDSRHGLKEIDLEIMKMLDDAAVSYHLVLTKADKVKASELQDVEQRTAEEARKHPARSEEHTSELQSLMRISYAVFCLKKKTTETSTKIKHQQKKIN